MKNILPFKNELPRVEPSCFIAPDSFVSGRVNLGKDSSVFFGSVLRGDILPIIVGEKTNIQDHCLLHTSHGLTPCVVGSDVTVGHRAILHGCEIRDRVIIGMGSIVLDGAVVEEDCILGANSLVPMNKVITAGSLAYGSPAKVVRSLTEKEIQSIRESARSYVETARIYRDYFA